MGGSGGLLVRPWCSGGRASGTDESPGSSFKEQTFHF
jgi:hypothetical protein